MPKYLNREYGFAGRPPVFSAFTEESDRPDGAEEGEVPEKARVGFGLDPKNPSAALLAGRNGTLWQLFLEIRKNGKYVPAVSEEELSGDEFYVSEHAATFTDFSANGVFRFAETGDGKCVLSFTPKKKTKLRLSVKSAGAAYATVQSERDLVKGRGFRRGVLRGEIELRDGVSEIRNRFTVLQSDGDQKDYFVLKSFTVPDGNAVAPKSVVYEYDAQPLKPLTFFAAVGDKAEALNVPDADGAEESLQKAILSATKIEESGAGVAEARLAALKEVRRHLAYDPYLMSLVLSEAKEEEDGFFGYDGLERGLGAIVAAIAGEYEAAETMAASAASDPVFGALALFVVYRHTKNKEFLKSALPRAMEAFEDGEKLIVADPKKKREISYRQTGSPLKEDLARKGAAYSVDMSSYKLLSFNIIAVLLEESGVDASDYLEKIAALKKNLNDLLYRKELGIYMNRHLTGEWAVGYGFTSFLPVLAGAAEDAEILNELTLTLKNPKKFWDNALFPTLSKDNYFYGKKITDAEGEKAAKYENFSGMISPWANALLYAGFRRAGMAELNFSMAESSKKLFRREYLLFGEYPAFYRPDLRRSTAKRKRALSSLILPLLGSIELLDYDYAAEGAIRFGVSAAGEHSVKGVRINGTRADFVKTDLSASLFIGGAEVFRGEPGNFEVRGYAETGGAAEFYFRSSDSVKLTLKTPLFDDTKKRAVTFRLEAGKHFVEMRDGKVRVKTLAL